MTKPVSFSNPSISVKPNKTIPRAWKLPLQKEVCLGVRRLWCRPDTAQECAISCFLQHQKNQRARDRLPAHSSNPSSQKVLHRGDLSLRGLLQGCAWPSVHLLFFFFLFSLGGFAAVVAVVVFSLWLHIPFLKQPCANLPCTRSWEVLGTSLVWRPILCHKAI